MERKARRLHTVPMPLSPGRTTVWVEPRRRRSPTTPTTPSPAASPATARRVPVVYYLCRDRQLEHPHFMEVPLSSPDGLFMKDVIEKLNALRGNGMSRMYSWSCKRRYKNGFVWHDLSEDDLVLPAHGNEYVLKGSELLDRSPATDHRSGNYGTNGKTGNAGALKQESPGSIRTRPDSSSSSPHSSSSPAMIVKKVSCSSRRLPHHKIIQENVQCYTPQSGSSENPSPEQRSSNDCQISVLVGAQNAGTQTKDLKYVATINGKDLHTAGVSTEDGASDGEPHDKHEQSNAETMARRTEFSLESPPPASSASSTGRRLDTLESLIREEAIRSSSRMLNNGGKTRAPNMFMQLITCGSLSIKDHRGFGVVPSYKSKFPQSAFSTPRPVGLKPEDVKFLSGEFAGAYPSLNHSTSCEDGRAPNVTQTGGDSASRKCLPQTLKIRTCKQGRSASAFSRKADATVSSSPSPAVSSTGTSGRIVGSISTRGSSLRSESFREEKVIKVEES